MSMRMDEIERTWYVSWVKGHNGQLLHQRAWKNKPPQKGDLAEQLAMFNFTRKDQFRSSSAVVVKHTSALVKEENFEVDELERWSNVINKDLIAGRAAVGE